MFDADAIVSPSGVPPGASSRGELAVWRLRDAILRCDLAPEAVLHEARLAERFGLGRAGVRSGLAALAREGFVERHPRQGWCVAPVDGALLASVLDARRRLEPSLGTWRPNPDDMRVLRTLAATVEALSGRGSPEALAAARAADRQIRATLRGGAAPMARGWLASLADHGDRILWALERDGVAVAPTPWMAVLDAFADGAPAATAALGREIERFADAVARGLIARASRPGEARPPLRRRARRIPAGPPSPSPALSKD